MRQLRQAGVVARGERGQRDLLIARLIDQLFGQVENVLHAALAHRAVDHACLAEAAAARAAAQHFDVDAVVHNLHERHDDALRILGLVKVGHHVLDDGAGYALLRRLKGLQRAVLVVGCLIEAGHIDAAEPRQPAQAFLSGNALSLARLHHVDGLQRADFAVSNGKRVDEMIQRLRIERARAARNDDRIVPGAVLAVQRNAGQIEELQDVGIAHLILQRNAQHVKAADWRARLQRKQRHILLTHQVRHVHPRRKDALAKRVLPLIDDIIQDAGTQMGHAHLVHIRERKRIANRHAVRILEHGIHLAAHVPGRLLHPVQQSVDFLLEQSSSSLR